VPDAYFSSPTRCLFFDHQERRIKIVANAHVSEPAQADRATTRPSRRSRSLKRAERPARRTAAADHDEVAPLEPKVT